MKAHPSLRSDMSNAFEDESSSSSGGDDQLHGREQRDELGHRTERSDSYSVAVTQTARSSTLVGLNTIVEQQLAAQRLFQSSWLQDISEVKWSLFSGVCLHSEEPRAETTLVVVYQLFQS